MTSDRASGVPVAAEVTDDPARKPASLVANSTFMLVARGLTLAASGALSIFAIRTFSVDEYGRYAVALALITIVALVSEAGISSLALRTMSDAPGRAEETLGTAFAAEAATTVLAVAAIFTVALILGYPRSVFALLAIGSGLLLFEWVVPPIDATFKAQRLMSFVAVFTVVQAGVTALAGFVLVALGAGPAGLMAALAIGGAAGACAALLLLRRKLGLRPSWHGAWRKVVPFLRTAAPIGVTGAITVVYDRIDVLMVSKLDSTVAAATYSVPLAVIQYALLIPSAIGTAFFPLFGAQLREDREDARVSFFLLTRIFIFIAAPLALFLTGAAEDIVTGVFGDRYQASGTVLAVLAWTLVLGFETLLLWYALLATYRERGMMLVAGGGLILNVALNSVLIPRYGPTGAATALVISSSGVLVGQAWMLHRHVFEIPFARLLGWPVVAAAVAVSVTVVVRPVSEILAGLAGAGTLAGILLASRYVAPAEWQPLTQPVASAVRRLRRR